MTYTHGHTEPVLRSHRTRNVDNSARYLLSHLIAGRSLLDVGCGPGSLTTDLARRLAPGRVVGVDSEPAVLAEARRAAAESGVGNVEFHESDAYTLPYDDGSFDIVHAHQLLQHLEHPERALEEMRRVARSGGIVAARDVDFGTFIVFPSEPFLDRWLTMYKAVHSANGGEPEAGRRLRSWARAAGLEEVTSSASAWSYATEDERSHWAEMWADRTTETVLGSRARDLGLASEGDLVEMAAAWRRWQLAPDGWAAVMHGEIVCPT